MNNFEVKYKNKEKILLIVLPFLTPLCPPMGVSSLKTHLEEHGYRTKAIDVMTVLDVREVCYRYFETLKAYIPEKKRGFYFNIALDVLSNHFMAHINYDDEKRYRKLVEILVYKNFYEKINEKQINELISITDEFYVKLEKYLVELIKKENPTIISISTYKGTLAASMFTAKVIKERFSDIEILMGGSIFSQELYPDTPNFNLFMDKTPYIDKIFIGEGEILFSKYLAGELDHNTKVYKLEDIDSELVDINTLKLPDFSDFDLSNYPMLPTFTSRGCVYKCSFCAETVYWRKYRMKDVKRIVDEFEILQNRYGRNIFMLTDCLINPLVTDLSNEIINRDLRLYWDVYLKVDDRVCDLDYTLLWRKGGFYRARLGIESGSQHVLDMIDKKITVQQSKQAIKSLADAGIKTTTYWIAGHPGETEEDFQQTLDMLEELQDDIFEAECDPFRYFYYGQVNGDSWAKEKGNYLLYPEDVTNMLITQTWVLNEEPSREIIYERGWRFKEHCKKLGIPNPYSVKEIEEADRRWKKLHKNAVPTYLELSKGITNLEESRDVKQLIAASKREEEDVEFDF